MALEVTDPFKGKKYSDTPMSKLDKNPTHAVLPIAGTGKAVWCQEIGRWVV